MPSTLVLMAVYQGADFLKEQIKSLARQSVERVHILASDDGSSDGSMEILEAARRRWKKGVFQIVNGPQNGAAENFRSLILNTEIEADYYAFSDQDDIWDKEKLEKAIVWSASNDTDQPQVFASRTRIVDQTCRPIGFSPLFPRPPSFQNALVQSIAGGNTMVLNKTAHELIRKTANRTGFVSHDWWIYQIVTGANGLFHYHAEPTISYRQHDANHIGANNSAKARLIRIKKTFKGQMKRWSEHNIVALEKCEDLFTPSAKAALASFKLAHSASSPMERFKALRRSGVYRQTLPGQISLYGASALNLL